MTEYHVELLIKTILLLLTFTGLTFIQLLSSKVSKYIKPTNFIINSITHTTIDLFYQELPELYVGILICYYIIHYWFYKPLLFIGHILAGPERKNKQGVTLLAILITSSIIMASRRQTPERQFEETDHVQSLPNNISPLGELPEPLFPNITPGQNVAAMQAMNRRMTSFSPGAFVDHEMTSPIAQAALAPRHALPLTPNPIYQPIEEEPHDYFADEMGLPAVACGGGAVGGGRTHTTHNYKHFIF